MSKLYLTDDQIELRGMLMTPGTRARLEVTENHSLMLVLSRNDLAESVALAIGERPFSPTCMYDDEAVFFTRMSQRLMQKGYPEARAACLALSHCATWTAIRVIISDQYDCLAIECHMQENLLYRSGDIRYSRPEGEVQLTAFLYPDLG